MNPWACRCWAYTCNSGTEGVNSGTEGVNSGTEGVNSGTEGVNSGRREQILEILRRAALHELEPVGVPLLGVHL